MEIKSTLLENSKEDRELDGQDVMIRVGFWKWRGVMREKSAGPLPAWGFRIKPHILQLQLKLAKFLLLLRDLEQR